MAAGLRGAVLRAVPEPIATAVRRHRRARSLAELAVGDDPVPDEAGRPVPATRLRVLVAGSEDRAEFLASGARHAEALVDLLSAVGQSLGPGVELIDFGCGCGRVARHLLATGAVIRGCDLNPELVAWTRDRLGIEAATVGISPPSPLPSAGADALFAHSVLTHLTGAQQRAWVEEWIRLVRPGGHLVVTTHGENRVGDLDPRAARLFAEGELVVVHPSAAGENLCRAYLPAALAPRLFAPLEIVEHRPAGRGPEARHDQDWWLLRRP